MFFTDKEFVAKKFKEYRKRLGYTQAQLAEKVGLTDQHICRIENADYQPSLNTFFKIIEALNINVNEFITSNYENASEARQEILRLIHTSSDKEIGIYLSVLKNLKVEISKII